MPQTHAALGKGEQPLRPISSVVSQRDLKLRLRQAMRPACSLIQLTFSYPAEGSMTETEITQVIALSACVSAFVSLVLLAAFR
jgi:hypothetical protein